MPVTVKADNVEQGTLTSTGQTGTVRGNKVSLWLSLGSSSSASLQFKDLSGTWRTVDTWTSSPDPTLQIVEDVVVRDWRLDYTHSADSSYSIRAVTDTRG